ncbi:unnamed protein product [Nyctereutes procyonoides]|uniref:(raccoon dog) hypothetical protein n=1 Tax=Nyctereutes procyonoides TaxID=34880 RepID=A0A811YHU8_NYCPR|nr:unnamed protein product [Nyctereutes procyonoides]
MGSAKSVPVTPGWPLPHNMPRAGVESSPQPNLPAREQLERPLLPLEAISPSELYLPLGTQFSLDDQIPPGARLSSPLQAGVLQGGGRLPLTTSRDDISPGTLTPQPGKQNERKRPFWDLDDLKTGGHIWEQDQDQD